MALPKLSQPTFTLTIPSSKKQVRYRPFTVKEEKLLMVAQSSGEREDYVNTFKQLITNCCIDPIDVDDLASYDIEYFFLNLRAKSVSNVVKLSIEDEHGKTIEVDVNLDDAKVHESTVSNKLVLDEAKQIGIKLRYPTFADIASLARRENGDVAFDDGIDLFISMIELIWEGENVHIAKEYSNQELRDFLGDFRNPQIKMVEDFLADLPYVYLDINYVDSQGEQKTRRITGIDSFFG